FYGWPHSDIFAGTFKALGFRIVSHLAFVKNVWGLGRFTRGQHETAFLLAKGRPKILDDAISDVIEWTREQDAAHPNQSPFRPCICSSKATHLGAVLYSTRSWGLVRRSVRRKISAARASASRSRSAGAATRQSG